MHIIYWRFQHRKIENGLQYVRFRRKIETAMFDLKNRSDICKYPCIDVFREHSSDSLHGKVHIK